jgi:hypothetical protein
MPGSPRKVISKHCATRQELFPTTLFLDNLRCGRPLLLDSSPSQSKTKTHQFSTIHRNLLIFATRTKANSADSCDSSAAAALQFDLPSPHSPVPPKQHLHERCERNRNFNDRRATSGAPYDLFSSESASVLIAPSPLVRPTALALTILRR